ncbi:MAG TPA: helix-turn-helix transcriptional regulator [Pseudolysinimonas sp.]|nr:helix-turn-helix transcriptional regulator [Pseudolysinimonas sp.]
MTRTTEEWQRALGMWLRETRLARGLDQNTVAVLADISTRSLRNLESGDGSSLASLIKTVRALGREDWLEQLDEGIGEPSPLELLRESRNRPMRPQRAPRRRQV